jgi:hypothetical protein
MRWYVRSNNRQDGDGGVKRAWSGEEGDVGAAGDSTPRSLQTPAAGVRAHLAACVPVVGVLRRLEPEVVRPEVAVLRGGGSARSAGNFRCQWHMAGCGGRPTQQDVQRRGGGRVGQGTGRQGHAGPRPTSSGGPRNAVAPNQRALGRARVQPVPQRLPLIARPFHLPFHPLLPPCVPMNQGSR